MTAGGGARAGTIDTSIYVDTFRLVSAALVTATAARLFHALSDPTRLALLAELRGGERCVCELQDLLGAAQSRLSFHLKVLREAGVVGSERQGLWAYYYVVPDALEELSAWLS